jgi:hypothetical protein
MCTPESKVCWQVGCEENAWNCKLQNEVEQKEHMTDMLSMGDDIYCSIRQLEK